MNTDEQRLGIASGVLQSFLPAVRLYRHENTAALRMCWDVRGGQPRYDFVAHLRGDGSWPKYGYDQRPTGGTGFQALAQIIRYVRDWSRLPLMTWEYWAGEKVKLCNVETLNLLRNSDYGNPEKTCCILCGTTEFKNGLDWWSLNGKTGPSCWGGRCREGATS